MKVLFDQWIPDALEKRCRKTTHTAGTKREWEG